MTQEEKELLIKDLCARLPYGVKLQKTYEECNSLELRSFDIDNDKLVFYKYKGEVLTICDTDSIERFGQIKYKPYLFPMSSMTDEQKRAYNMMSLDADWVSNPHYSVPAYNVLDWLNENHLDYRDLIGKGLAIDATNKNIY